MTRTKTLILALFVGLIAAAFMLMASSQPSWAGDNKVWVCKYVGTPGQDERLKAGKQPISVSSNATVGSWFNDAQGRSYVLAIDEKGKQDDDKYTAADCPAGSTPTPTPTPTETATPTVTASPSVSVSVSPSETVTSPAPTSASPSGSSSTPNVSESPDPELPVELADTGSSILWLTAIGAGMVAFGYWLSGNKPRH